MPYPAAAIAPPALLPPASLQALQQFRALMGAQGHGVQMARMCFDRLYAYERIALAHAGGDPALRELALQLFQACHYGDPAHQADA